MRKPIDDDAVVDDDDDDGPLKTDEAPREKVEQRCRCGAEMRRLGGVVTMRLLSRVTMLAAAVAAGANDLMLRRLRDELLPPTTSQQPLLDVVTPTPKQLESSFVLAFVEWRLTEMASDAQPVPARYSTSRSGGGRPR